MIFMISVLKMASPGYSNIVTYSHIFIDDAITDKTTLTNSHGRIFRSSIFNNRTILEYIITHHN